MQFKCTECAATYLKWAGKCNSCNKWNTIEESFEKKDKKMNANIESVDIAFVTDALINFEKVPTNLEEFNRAIGGGLTPGGVILLAGDPGIGKSTLLLQICNSTTLKRKILYISGEESTNQIKQRAQRLNITNENLLIVSVNSLEIVLSVITKYKSELDLIVIDSIQTLASENIQNIAGSINQIKYCSQSIVDFAKKENVPIIIVSHITKEGIIAGPKLLEHSVDTVLYFEGEKNYTFRILRTIKNRFGPSDEMGIFEFKNECLQEVSNPSMIFLNEQKKDAIGSVIFSSLEGTRPVLVEIQALVSTSFLQMPRRAVIGWDNNRLPMLCAVLEKHCKIFFNNKDVYVTVMGGIKINEPAADLAIILAILSSHLNIPLQNGLVAFGEISLSGEIRTINQFAKRINEANKLQCKTILMHETKDEKFKETIQMATIQQVIAWLKKF